MLQYEVLKHELNEKQAALDEQKDALGLERLREEVEMRENKAAEPGFYDNMESAQKLSLIHIQMCIRDSLRGVCL